MLHNYKRCVYSRGIKRNKPPETNKGNTMHPQLEAHMETLPKRHARTFKEHAKMISKAIPDSENIIAHYRGLGSLYVLTDKALYWKGMMTPKSIQLKAVTTVKHKMSKVVVETSSESAKITPGNTLGKVKDELKAYEEFVKAIQSAL